MKTYTAIITGTDQYGFEKTEEVTITRYNLFERIIRRFKRRKFRKIKSYSIPGYTMTESYPPEKYEVDTVKETKDKLNRMLADSMSLMSHPPRNIKIIPSRIHESDLHGEVSLDHTYEHLRMELPSPIHPKQIHPAPHWSEDL